MGRWCLAIALCVGFALCSVQTGMLAARAPQDDGVSAGLPPALAQFYEFVDATASDGDVDEIRIGVRPRQKHPLLIDGAIYLSASSSDLLRVEGRLSKSPSFRVTRVDIIRRYARIRGVRVPVELHTVAHVRLAGRSEMRVQYFYDSVNGQPVEDPS